METRIKTGIGTNHLVIMALMIALSFAGSHIRIFGSIAFDSLPGFLVALLLGPVHGAVIGFLGHVFTAMISGFPLSFPLHMVIAFSMALTMLMFGYTYRALNNKISKMGNIAITGIVGVVLNGPVSLAFSMGVMSLIAGREAAMGMLVMLLPLVAAAATNVVLCFVLFKALGKEIKKII